MFVHDIKEVDNGRLVTHDAAGTSEQQKRLAQLKNNREQARRLGEQDDVKEYDREIESLEAEMKETNDGGVGSGQKGHKTLELRQVTLKKQLKAFNESYKGDKSSEVYSAGAKALTNAIMAMNEEQLKKASVTDDLLGEAFEKVSGFSGLSKHAEDGGVGSGQKGHKTFRNEIGEISKEQYEKEKNLYAQYGKDRDYKKYILALRKLRGESQTPPPSGKMMEIKNLLGYKSRQRKVDKKFADSLNYDIRNIEKDTTNNHNFRKIIFTSDIQISLMCLKSGEDIGEEIHPVDQFFRFDNGTGKAFIDGDEILIEDGFSITVPAGSKHNILNTGEGELQFYTIYGRPLHEKGEVIKTREEAFAKATKTIDGGVGSGVKGHVTARQIATMKARAKIDFSTLQRVGGHIGYRELGQYNMYGVSKKSGVPKVGSEIDYFDKNGNKQDGEVIKISGNKMAIKDLETNKIIIQTLVDDQTGRKIRV